MKAFDDFSMGYASALAWLLLVLTLVVTLIQFKISKKYVHYQN
jgi:multiple sugar transport system permease protein